MLLRWVPASPRELTELLPYRMLDEVSLSELPSDSYNFELVFIVISLQTHVLRFHLLQSLFEHLLPLLTSLNFSRFLLKVLSVLYIDIVKLLYLPVDPFNVVVC